MKNRSIHKNLDTSFVNLSALIKYLRRRQFVGNVKVQLNGYRADIQLKEENVISVHEHDQISGRISEGEEAFQRLLIRSREPGGTVDVFQDVSEEKAASEAPKPQSVQNGNSAPRESTPGKKAKNQIPKLPKSAPPVRPASKPSNGFGKATVLGENKQQISRSQKTVAQAAIPIPSVKPQPITRKQTSLPNFPFRLSNEVESKAQKILTPEDWQNVLKLTVELLTVIDRSLAAANLNFSAELSKTCADIADDYPFLSSSSEIFRYSNGKIEMQKQLSEKIFISGIAEALRRILIKLSKSRKYSEIYKLTAQRLQILITKRSAVYTKFGISSQVRRIVSR